MLVEVRNKISSTSTLLLLYVYTKLTVDVRVLYAMESHGVKGSRLRPQLDPALMSGPADWSEQTKTVINQVIPVLSILSKLSEFAFTCPIHAYALWSILLLFLYFGMFFLPKFCIGDEIVDTPKRLRNSLK